jgi:hypothetical protein
MLTVKDPVTAGKPPRKFASTFRPDSGHFSVQNLAPSDACVGVVTVNTNKRWIFLLPLTPKIRQESNNIEFLLTKLFYKRRGQK